MGEPTRGEIAVVGATGLTGGAVARRLLEDGWRVRAVTRSPASHKARALASQGADVVGADANDPASLERAFAGVHGVYTVQNHHISGYEGEVVHEWVLRRRGHGPTGTPRVEEGAA